MPRLLSIRNAHPRLRLPRAAVTRAIALLDGKFPLRRSDLPFLVLPSPRLSALRRQLGTAETTCGIVPPGELSIAFLTDPALAQIHADFMDDPSATDVITFEGEAAAGLAGEICVSVDTAARYVGAPAGTARARRPATAVEEQFATELTLYVVHGWLHLAGYDDLAPARKRRMRAAEARALQLLADHDALPAFRLR